MSDADQAPYLEFMEQETLQGYLEYISNHHRLEMDYKEMLDDFSQFDDEVESMIQEAEANGEVEDLLQAVEVLLEMPDSDLAPFSGNSYEWRLLDLSRVLEYVFDKMQELTKDTSD